ncbi:HK97 gp10 family phage protein [Rouxiella badensis]|nr:HK97 gp10 family phage protein [Rouxiella badensis]
MADGIEFSLIGLDSLLGKLDSISDDLKKKGGRASLRRAANIIANKARENARRVDDIHTGRSIADNIAIRWNGKLFKSTGDLGFRVGVLHGAVLNKHPDLAKNAPTPHWRLLEFGTEKMKAHPIMRPAIASSVGDVVNTFTTEYEKAIDRAIRRAQKKGVLP